MPQKKLKPLWVIWLIFTVNTSFRVSRRLLRFPQLSGIWGGVYIHTGKDRETACDKRFWLYELQRERFDVGRPVCRACYRMVQGKRRYTDGLLALVLARWYWKKKRTTVLYRKYDFQHIKALTPGTEENIALLNDIDTMARKLKQVQDAGVPVLFRPLHEAEGGWFWWGAEGPEPCVRLYRLLYDKFTNEYGLNNLIWVWTSYDYETSAAWYPGDDVVDIIGYDKYNAKDGKPMEVRFHPHSTIWWNLLMAKSWLRWLKMIQFREFQTL